MVLEPLPVAEVGSVSVGGAVLVEIVLTCDTLVTGVIVVVGSAEGLPVMVVPLIGIGSVMVVDVGKAEVVELATVVLLPGPFRLLIVNFGLALPESPKTTTI
jgi:hypothetical protein